MQDEDKDDTDIPTIASTTAMSQITTSDIPGQHDNFNDSSAKHIEKVQSNTIETIEAATKAKTAH